MTDGKETDDLAQATHASRVEDTRVQALCRRYLAALEAGDLDALLGCFAPGAVANSPVFGPQPARDFYSHILSLTSDRRMEVKTVFVSAPDPPTPDPGDQPPPQPGRAGQPGHPGQPGRPELPSRAAVHVAYTRTIADHAPATIEAVDIFDLTPDGERFAAVTIVYDTAPVRGDFDAVEGGEG